MRKEGEGDGRVNLLKGRVLETTEGENQSGLDRPTAVCWSLFREKKPTGPTEFRARVVCLMVFFCFAVFFLGRRGETPVRRLSRWGQKKRKKRKKSLCRNKITIRLCPIN